MSNVIPGNLDEARVAELVGRFYDKVRRDALLGPVFNAVVEDWDAHKVLMTSFWATVALRTGHYRGNPLAKHQPLPIDAGHFERWLALWREAAGQTLGGESAALMIGYAERVGYGMQVGLGLSGPQRGRESGIPIRAQPPGSTGPALRLPAVAPRLPATAAR